MKELNTEQNILDFLTEWAENLRSGNFRQGKGALYTPQTEISEDVREQYPDLTNEHSKYCSLGVACITLGVEKSDMYVVHEDHIESYLLPMSIGVYIFSCSILINLLEYTDKELKLYRSILANMGVTKNNLTDSNIFANMNDILGLSFEQIANVIDEIKVVYSKELYKYNYEETNK